MQARGMRHFIGPTSSVPLCRDVCRVHATTRKCAKLEHVQSHTQATASLYYEQRSYTGSYRRRCCSHLGIRQVAEAQIPGTAAAFVEIFRCFQPTNRKYEHIYQCIALGTL